ncbi:hypothetical protein [Phenylobacterium sp.]|uniref:hypothetical protein n=1 Tax=Phenylobacterium sp. TaxID=1871053 RepID=UPI002F93D895
MYKRSILGAAALAALAAGVAQAAPASAPAPALAWVIQPAGAACKTELELAGKSGAIVPVTLVSDGERTVLRFAKDDLPERAFLPIRIDQKPYSNLMLRTDNPAVGELVLSAETQAALRKGSSLQVAWLSEEPVGASLAGSDHAVPDLATCGAQAASQERAHLAAESEAKARADAEARERALAEAQLEAARAQAAVAEAQRLKLEEDAERLRAEADAERQRIAYEEARLRREEQEADRQRAYQEALRRYGYDQPRQNVPAPQAWPPTPRYPYRRY